MQMVGHPPEWNPENAKAEKYNSELKLRVQIHERKSITGLNKQENARQKISDADSPHQPSQTIQVLTLHWCDRAHDGSNAQRPRSAARLESGRGAQRKSMKKTKDINRKARSRVGCTALDTPI
jgi:hypothetical protein